MLKYATILLKILVVLVILILILSCKSGSDQSNNDVCFKSHLIYFDETRTYTRQEKEDLINNNRFACEVCKFYLTFEEQTVCSL